MYNIQELFRNQIKGLNVLIYYVYKAYIILETAKNVCKFQ